MTSRADKSMRAMLLHAGMVVDGAGRRFAPGAVLIADGRVMAAGSPEHVGDVGEGVAKRMLPDHVLMPGLVNVHTHLDLTHIGPRPYGGSFVDWVHVIRHERLMDPAGIAESVQLGVQLSRAGGTALVGDIAGVGSLQPIRTLRELDLPGVSFIEVFGQGRNAEPARRSMEAIIGGQEALVERNVQLGLQPHAPFSCSEPVYRAAAELALAHGLPLATHLAETREEIAFTQRAEGPLAEMLKTIGVWDETITGRGMHPIDLLADIIASVPVLAAHVNYVDDEHIERLALSPISVAYCPRASAYFGHESGHGSTEGGARHRYRDMLAAGMNVALGTDSIVCLDTPERISVFDEMRLLYRRDGTDPMLLLRMASINGATALGFDPNVVSFNEGPIAGVIGLPFDAREAADPLSQVLLDDRPLQWISAPTSNHI